MGCLQEIKGIGRQDKFGEVRVRSIACDAKSMEGWMKENQHPKQWGDRSEARCAFTHERKIARDVLSIFHLTQDKGIWLGSDLPIRNIPSDPKLMMYALTSWVLLLNKSPSSDNFK